MRCDVISDVIVIYLVLIAPLLAWRAWLALYPGLSLRSDYGIRGGWFGTGVFLKDPASSPRHSASS